MVRVRTLKEPAVLRRVTRGDGAEPEAGGDHGAENGRLVRLQAFERDAVLRWDALKFVMSQAGNLMRET